MEIQQRFNSPFVKAVFGYFLIKVSPVTIIYMKEKIWIRNSETNYTGTSRTIIYDVLIKYIQDKSILAILAKCTLLL